MSEPIRLALTISGAVSLGAFEGGALAAILGFVQAAGADQESAVGAAEGEGPAWPVVVDVMSGASAGSITALLAARTLTAGLDPVAAMRAAWVSAPSLRTLTRGAARAPLTPDGLRQQATEILSMSPSRAVQPQPVTVHMALTALAGLRYSIPDLASGQPLRATTHLDWGEFTFAPGAPIGEWTAPAGGSAVDIALASGASALAFPPYPVNRKLRPADWETYLRNGVEGLPADGWLWYTDGGTIENEPLGRTLDLAASVDRGSSARRVHILVHPHPTAPTGGHDWRGPHGPRGAWLRSLARADQIQRTQTLFDDLRRAERTNSRLLWRRQLAERLLTHREGLDEPGRRSFDAAIGAALDGIRDDRRMLREQAQADRIGLPAAADPASPAGGAAAPELDPAKALEAILDEITATGGRPVAFAVVSPADIAEEHNVTVEDLLAGEFLFHFGGFLDERLRAHDFAVGYDAALRWLRAASADDGPLASLSHAARWADGVAEVRPRWSLPAPVVSPRTRWQAIGLGLRAAALAGRDLLVWRPWRRR